METHSSILPGKFQQRSLAGYRPWMESHEFGNGCDWAHTQFSTQIIMFSNKEFYFYLYNVDGCTFYLFSCLVALKLPVKHWTEFMTVDILALFLITSITLAVGLFINALDWVKEVPSHLLVCWEFLARMGIDFVKCFLYTYWKNHVIFH